MKPQAISYHPSTMHTFRNLVDQLEAAGDLLKISRPVKPQFELSSLLKQAEQRRKAILFESVEGSSFPVVGGVFSTPERLALGLGRPNPANYAHEQLAVLVENAVAKPLAVVSNEVGVSQEITLAGKQIDTGLLPVPTFFEHDSGPFLTGAIGISRNPSNNVLNAGYYRVLITGVDQVALSVSPTSDLLRFIQADKKADRSTQVALVVGGPASLALAAAAKVPADVSELDVAGALDGTHMEVVQATNSDLLVPAEAEFIIEITLDHAECIPNTMGEFGDLYGSQTAQVATVTAITHRENALFHVVMAGAGREHNNLGMPVLYEVTMGLREQLQTSHPDVKDCRVLFDPPSMGTTGEIYVQLSADAEIDAARLAREIYAMKCGRYDLARVIHKVLVVDADIDINSNLELRWAMNNRATADERYQLIDDLQAAGGKLRVAIDATVRSEDRETLQRLITPGAENVRLDDYLGDAAGNSNK